MSKQGNSGNNAQGTERHSLKKRWTCNKELPVSAIDQSQ